MDSQSVVNSLIHEVKKRPLLWDKKHELYQDRCCMDKVWDEIAVALNKNKKQIKIKWRNLRHQFYREIRKNPVDKVGRPILDQYPGKWAYYELLSFLKDSVNWKPTGEKDDELQDEVEHEELQYDEEDEVMQTEDLTQEDHDYSVIKVDLGLDGDIEGEYIIDALDSEDGQEIQEDSSESNMATQVESNERPRRRLSQQLEFIEKPKRNLTPSERLKLRQKRSEAKSSNIRRQNGIQTDSHRTLEKMSGRPVDDDLYFALSLVPYLRRLDPLRKLLVRHEMQGLLIGELIGESSSIKNNPKKFNNYKDL